MRLLESPNPVFSLSISSRPRLEDRLWINLQARNAFVHRFYAQRMHGLPVQKMSNVEHRMISLRLTSVCQIEVKDCSSPGKPSPPGTSSAATLPLQTVWIHHTHSVLLKNQVVSGWAAPVLNPTYLKINNLLKRRMIALTTRKPMCYSTQKVSVVILNSLQRLGNGRCRIRIGKYAVPQFRI